MVDSTTSIEHRKESKMRKNLKGQNGFGGRTVDYHQKISLPIRENSKLKARENTCDQVEIGFGFAI